MHDAMIGRAHPNPKRERFTVLVLDFAHDLFAICVAIAQCVEADQLQPFAVLYVLSSKKRREALRANVGIGCARPFLPSG
jgi:hypothetical protein